ncbi:type IV pilin protein [Halomonas sp. 11-S5]|uniref:type IV pilin protein n=1 Tax=Halomonas sp. 11-S5 TaxID=2994064 RepID=UPI0024684113|nr:type IV pilin protein [Halomonas sp. 11-S5]
MTPTSIRFRPQGPSGSARRSAGFTLIELMIVVAIVAILASIAYPSYTRYVERSKRTDAYAGLQNAAGVLERCYTVYNSYNDSNCSLEDGNTLPSPEDYYTIFIAASGSSYTVSAKLKSGSDGCSGDLTLDHQGVKTPDACW